MLDDVYVAYTTVQLLLQTINRNKYIFRPTSLDLKWYEPSLQFSKIIKYLAGFSKGGTFVHSGF